MKLGVFTKGIGQQPQDRLWEVFHENSKNRTYVCNFGAPGKSAASAEGAFASRFRLADSPQLPLPKPAAEIGADLMVALRSRRSATHFEKNTLGLDHLATVLFAASGITSKVGNGRRAAPSAGALYPLDVVVFARTVESIPPGLYHYDVVKHSLGAFPSPNKALQWDDLFIQSELRDAAVVLLLMASFERLSVKYGERGYRYVFLEAGHIVQNAALACAALQIPLCPLGGYFDDRCEGLVTIDGVRQSIVYCAAIGG